MELRMVRVRLGRQGRLVVPAELRRELGIVGEDDLVAWAEDGKLVFQRRAAFEEELWKELVDADWTVDDFVAERRDVAAREWGQLDEPEAGASTRS